VSAIDDDQLKAKIGQILYNNYITDRLREEVIQRVAHRNSMSLRMTLGRDSSGEEIFLDILINRTRPDVEQLKRSVANQQLRSEDSRKYTCIILSSNSTQSSDNTGIATNFEYLMSQSLNWWARYSGSRDSLNVEKWKILHAITVDSKDAFLASEIPIDSVLVPDSRKYEVGDVEKYAEALESLPPIVVRPRENSRFELIQGYHVFLAHMRAGKREILSIVKWVDDEEANRIYETGRKAWHKIAPKTR